MPSSNKKTWSSFGECFKEFRAIANVSLEELSDISKIQIRHLQNLEEENFNKLPPYVYVRGFIARTSVILAARMVLETSKSMRVVKKEKDTLPKRAIVKSANTENAKIYSYKECNDILQRLYSSKQGIYSISHLEVGESNNSRGLRSGSKGRKLSGYNAKKEFSRPKTFLTPKVIVYFGTFLFLAVVSTYIVGRFVPFVFAPRIVIDSPASENTVVNFQDMNVKGNVEWVSSLTMAGRALYIDENGEFQESVSLSEGINILALEGKNIFGRKVEVVRRVVYIKN